MTLNYTGVPFDFDLPALLALQSGLIPVLGQKQPHFLSGAAVSCAGTQDGKLNHPAGVILKTLHGLLNSEYIRMQYPDHVKVYEATSPDKAAQEAVSLIDRKSVV